MEINPEIYGILKEFKIDKSQGMLCLLGIYYDLDTDTTCNEETIKAINLTKIVEKDYAKKALKWNKPLFIGQNIEWEWVKEWNSKWNANMERKASNPDCTKRMRDFFMLYPQYRKDDVIEATNNYMRVTTPAYYKNSAAFIFDGAGAMKKSILLGWCEKVVSGKSTTNMKGKTIT